MRSSEQGVYSSSLSPASNPCCVFVWRDPVWGDPHPNPMLEIHFVLFAILSGSLTFCLGKLKNNSKNTDDRLPFIVRLGFHLISAAFQWLCRVSCVALHRLSIDRFSLQTVVVADREPKSKLWNWVPVKSEPYGSNSGATRLYQSVPSHRHQI